MRLDLGQDYILILGAKRHVRRSGAHDKKHDQHYEELREFGLERIMFPPSVLRV